MALTLVAAEMRAQSWEHLFVGRSVPWAFAKGSSAFTGGPGFDGSSYFGWVDGSVISGASSYAAQTWGTGISADGQVIVGSIYHPDGDYVTGFRRDGSGPHALISGAFTGISSDGRVMVGWQGVNYQGPQRAIRQVANGEMEFLPDYPGGADESSASDISADGSMIVGQASGANGWEAVVWREGSVTGLGELPGGTFNSSVSRVSGNGAFIVGASQSANGLEACVWHDASLTALGDLEGGSFVSSATGVSNDGRIITGTATPAGTGGVPVVWIDQIGPFRIEEVVRAIGLASDVEGRWEIRSARPVSDDGKWIAVEARSLISSFSAVHRIGLPETAEPTPETSRLSNVSVRTGLAAGQVLTMGMVVDGGLKPVMVRAAGPALTALNVGLNGVPDPRLNTYRLRGAAADPVSENDNWEPSLASLASRLGAFPFPSESADAARLLPVSGPTTVEVRSEGSGVVLVEAYDAALEAAPRFSNLSVRHHTGLGMDALTAGFVIEGAAPVRLLLRAVGPTLTDQWGVPGMLSDPQIELLDAEGNRLAFNNNWESENAEERRSAMEAVGAFDLITESRDAALLVELTGGGLFTARATGVGGEVGEVLLEVYEIP